MSKSKTISIILIITVAICFLALPEFSFATSKGYFKFMNVADSKTIQRGNTFNLKYKVSNNYKARGIIWKSSNDKIATVNKKGKIKAKSDGVVLIKAYVKNHRGVKDIVSVTVRKNVKTVSFRNLKSGYVIDEGSSVKAKAAVLPTNASNRNVRWESSNPDVATVDNGVIKAIKNGSSVITIRSKDNGKIYKSVKIYIGKRADSLSVKGGTAVVEGKSLRLSGKVYPEYATNRSLNWTSSNKKIASVSGSGKVIGKKTGTVTITAETRDGTNKKITKRVKVVNITRNDANFIAHRGYCTIAPENTAEAYTLAGRAGFWGCECDVWETKHDVTAADEKSTFDIVIQHDSTFERMCGNSADVKSLTADQIKKLQVTGGVNASEYNQKVCFFSEYLSICKTYGMVPVVELKDPDMSQAGIERVVDMLYGDGLLNKAMVVSFHSDELAAANEYARNKYGSVITTYYLIGGSNDDDDTLDTIATAKNEGFTGVSLSSTYVNEAVNEYCKDNGIKLSVWTYSNNNIRGMYQAIEDYTLASVTVNGKLYN